MLRRFRAALVALAVTLVTAGTARADEPSNETLVWAGVGMAIPTYFLGVTLHEGSHALSAKAFGAEIVGFSVLPGVRDGHFYFGYTRWRGELSRGERAFTLLAPKLTDALLLGGYSVLVGLDALPDNAWAQLVLVVLATGAWVDFTKDVISRNPGNDVVKVYNDYGRTTEWRRLPYRLLHASLCVASAFVLAEGYFTLFDRDADPAGAPVVIPLFAMPF